MRVTTGAEGKKRGRVVSGMRPTGRLHIGHYFGALENWVRLQEEMGAGEQVGGATPAQQAAPVQRQDAGLKPGATAASPHGAYECFYFVADWHALTSDYADTSGVAGNTIEIVTDYLAAGLDPAKSVIFQQSLVPEHAELHLLLGMVTPLSWLERVPTYKEQIENVTSKDLHNYGFLGYPCLQTADIVIYSEEGVPLFVPVGEDQVSHVELSREIVRKFNFHFALNVDENAMEATLKTHDGHFLMHVMKDVVDSIESGIVMHSTFSQVSKIDVRSLGHRIRVLASQSGVANVAARAISAEATFKNLTSPVFSRFVRSDEVINEPAVMLTKTPRVPGLDGRKMSKSYGNAITLSETDEEIRKKTKVMVTDPARKRRTDPGNPDVCPVYDWHKLFSTPETLAWAAEGCRTAGIGCIECKAKMADHLITWIGPKREARNKWENDKKGVLEIIEDGSKRARVEAKKTMERVREAVFGWEKKKQEVLGERG